MKRISTHYAGNVGELLAVLQQLPPKLQLTINLDSVVEVIHWSNFVFPDVDVDPECVELCGYELENEEGSYGT